VFVEISGDPFIDDWIDVGFFTSCCGFLELNWWSGGEVLSSLEE
jgi:hypothetical protein